MRLRNSSPTGHSSGIKAFANLYSQKGKEFEASRLKVILRDTIKSEIIRKDLDVPSAAFMINSPSIMFMASLISGHF